MIQYVKQGGDFGRAFIQQLKERSANSGKKVDDAVAEIVETVHVYVAVRLKRSGTIGD